MPVDARLYPYNGTDGPPPTQRGSALARSSGGGSARRPLEIGPQASTRVQCARWRTPATTQFRLLSSPASPTTHTPSFFCVWGGVGCVGGGREGGVSAPESPHQPFFWVVPCSPPPLPLSLSPSLPLSPLFLLSSPLSPLLSLSFDLCICANECRFPTPPLLRNVCCGHIPRFWNRPTPPQHTPRGAAAVSTAWRGDHHFPPLPTFHTPLPPSLPPSTALARIPCEW